MRLRVSVLAAVLLLACGGGGAKPTAASSAATTTTASTTTTSTTTTTRPTTTTTPPVTMPNGDPVFDGFPHLVALDSVDQRVANWYKDTPSGQLVALAPGVYTPYNVNVPDLNSYLDGPASGDCAAKHKFFPTSGGACWEGVA